MSHPERSEGSSRILATCNPPSSQCAVAVRFDMVTRKLVYRGEMPHFVRHDINHPGYFVLMFQVMFHVVCPCGSTVS